MAEMTTLEDVAGRLGRPLEADERTLADQLITDVEDMIRVRLPGAVLNDTTADESVVRRVVGWAVVRVLRNPDGYRSETAGGVSYTIDTRAAAGFLTILDEEWRQLGLSPLRAKGGAGSFAPVLGTPIGPTPGWSPWL